jgi:hypothetical protein
LLSSFFFFAQRKVVGLFHHSIRNDFKASYHFSLVENISPHQLSEKALIKREQEKIGKQLTSVVL